MVSIPGVSAPANSEFVFSIVSGDLTGLGVTGYGIYLRYDSSILDYVSASNCTGGVATTGLPFNLVLPMDNEVRVGAATSSFYQGNGCLIQLRFRVKSGAFTGAVSALDIYRAEFTPDRPCTFFDGQIAVGTLAEVGLAPSYSGGVVSQPHTLTATLSQNGAPKAGATVNFEVISGPRAGLSFTSMTDVSGHASSSYTSQARGTDVIRVTAPTQAGFATPVYSSLAIRVWRNSATEASGGSVVDVGLRSDPNPFVSATRIVLVPPAGASPSLSIFNVRGQLVRNLLPSPSRAGSWVSVWDGRDASGARLPEGVYLLEARSTSEAWTSKLLLLAPSH